MTRRAHNIYSKGGIFPVLLDTVFSRSAAGGGTTRALNLPSSVAGDLIVGCVALDIGAMVSIPSGFTSISGSSYCFFKVATGSEGSSVNYTINNSSSASASIAFVIAKDTFQVTEVPITTATAPTGTNPDPPSIAPTAAKHLILNSTIWFGAPTISAYPANMPLYQEQFSNVYKAAVCGVETEATSFDPSAYTATTITTINCRNVSIRGPS